MKNEFTYSMYNALGISELVLLYLNNKTEETSSMIAGVIESRLEKYDIFREKNIIYEETSSVIKRIDDQKFIFKFGSNVNDLFDFFFNYIANNNIENALLDELIISRFFPLFITKEINNINKRLQNDNDINSKKTLEGAKRILCSYLDYDYEDIYRYIYECNPSYYRKMRKINKFVLNETKIMNGRVSRLLKLLGEDNFVDYEKESIYMHLNIKEGKVLEFKRKK